MTLAPVPALADGLIDNVSGMTLDKDGDVVRFTGLVIDDQGKVAKLLKKGDKRPEKLDFAYDAKGKTLMPGFIDGHGHVMETGIDALTLDLSDTRSFEEALQKIATYAKANPARTWIIGSGWNQEKWGLGRFPTAAELDAVVPDRPVWLARVDGHAGWANSKAMAAAGVDAKTKQPAGGQIIEADGKPSGIFVDAATQLIEKVVPQPAPRDLDVAFSRAQEEFLENGVTAVADMGTTLAAWQTFRRAGDRNTLRIRIMSYGLGIENMVAIAGPEPTPWLYNDKLRMGGVKLYLDGALGSRGAWLKQDYLDAPGKRGTPFLTDDQLRNRMVRASMDGFQVAAHAIGDAANAQMLDAIDELAKTYKGDRRWRIEHAQIIDPADLKRFGQNGIIASMQPSHEASDWTMAEARVGKDRLTGAYAWNTMLDNDVPLAFGSDTPVEPPNPFVGIAVAMSRKDANGQPVGGWFPEQRLSFKQAWNAYTIGAAYAGFAEGRFGSLTPGNRADFVLLSETISDEDPAQIRQAKVDETWVGGYRMYQRK